MGSMFLTGVTGFVGGEALKRYLLRDPQTHIYAMIRAVDDDRLAKRVDKLLDNQLGVRRAEFEGRVTFVRGDLLKDKLGMSDEDRATVVAECDWIVHCAASVDFGATLEFSREYNLDGTRRIIELAEEIQRSGKVLRRLDYVSTAYVSGNRSDVVTEDELSNHGIGWANFYEQSKFEAEALVRGWREQGNPVSIYRPSTVVGDSRTGATPNFNVLYWPLRVYARGWWNLMIGFEDTPVDVVPINYVADCLVDLSLAGEKTIGRNYHLTAGPDKVCRIRDLATHASAWFKQPYPKFVTPEMFWKVYRPAMDKQATPAQKTLIKQGLVYMPYFERSPLFDTSNTVADLKAIGGTEVVAVTDYFEVLFRYCVDTDWGRKPMPGLDATDPLRTVDPELPAFAG